MKSLNQFAGNSEVFPNAKVLPPFFQTNLVDSARVVKGFENDPQAYLRIFYYQYLKLCFQLQNVNYDMYIRKIQDIINNPEFNFIFYEHDDPSIFNDNQAKSLIMEFFGVLGEGHFNILKSLSRYPIMDTIFVHFFRSFIILTGITDSLDSYINRDELLDYLCKNFEVQVEIHGECIKFVETDIFVYEIHEAAVYMAYMDYQGENSQLEAQVKQNAVAQVINVKPQPVLNLSVNVSSSLNNVGGNERNKKALVQDSYIASQFVDFTTLTPSNNLASKAKPALKQYELYNQSKETSQKVLTDEVRKVQPSKFQSKYGNITDDYSSKNYGSFTQQKKVTQTTTNYQVNSQLSYQNNSKDTYSNQLKAKETNSYGSYNTNPLYNDTLIQQPKPIEPINSYKNYNPNTAINTNTNININSNINANSNIAFNNTNNNPPFNNHYSNFQPIPTKDTNIKTNININQQVNSQFNTNFNQNFPNNTPLPSSYNNINPNVNNPNNNYNNNNFNQNNNNNFSQNNNSYNNYNKVQANGINIQNNNNLYNNQSSKSQPVDPKKDIWFNPNINNTLNINTNNNNNNNKNIPPYQPNNNQSIYSTTQPPLVPGVTGKKKPFGLNVSEQFTNQNVMRYMAEPFKSNVEMMRDRARKFRSSLSAYVL